MARLIIYEEIETSETILETFELSSTRILIGSDPDNNLVLQSPDIDSSHASLELRNNLWVLQDLGGPGGTGVNGKVIKGPYYLTHNDLIELGPIKLSFQEKAAVEEAPPEEDMPLPPPPPKVEASPVKGRVWFAFIAGGTLAVIFIIMFLLIVADLLNVIEISDLLPLLMILS